MATLVHRLSKLALFLCLFALSIRYVRPYPYEWTESQTRAWLYTSQALGIRDPEDLYFMVWVTIEVVATVLAYIAIIRVWRYYCRKIRSKNSDRERSNSRP
ncbi:hypothetical protein FEQ05_05048 [Burkholderia pseudomultivorans]|uniref:Uncharacterized protein n=1 Tax=Burkholderia pseudomultivorans TaxID=1207504 RepID=A0ABU2E2D4_9BURK|nr:hypothetical protein [Burkholderia pseudomultivorans]MDR8726596.1 hypothetical protein [Burkholderia pseudomultivorans]MDR8736429.1 hypothetical protein [Burkholderia pseudomultivorans]MDR8742243.1 hypothetical protein [Burkholderia pseudomultivorans]MDR8754027.1 hypothetical protein [Burkholderia pseudomultivorans]MDR8778863.1 hypothetical protein [Burkholderia pseudomultivorans]